MVGALVLAGGAICASYGVYQYGIYQNSVYQTSAYASGISPSGVSQSGNGQLTMPWWKERRTQFATKKHSQKVRTNHQTQSDLWTSAALVGAAAVGGAGILPVPYIAIPILAYRGVPALQSTVDVLLHDRKASQGILETTALAIVLVKGAWVVGTVGFAVYHLGRWVIATTENAVDRTADRSYLIKRNGQEMDMSVQQLEAGDWVAVSASHYVPIKSRVVEGAAWISTGYQAENSPPLTVKPGDLLEKDSVVLAGNVWLEVAN